MEVERDEARRLARQELADPVYEDEPPLLQRIMEWLLRQLDELVSMGTNLGGWGVLALLIPVALIAAIVFWRVGPLARRGARADESVFGTAKRSAAEYRRAADDADVRQDWTASVLERFRAIVAGLEERDVLATTAGRTADEAAREAGRLLPALAERLSTAAVMFDDVRYGEQAATQQEASIVRDLERDVRAARISDVATDVPQALAVPR